jgi:flavin-dependent dehydrogenase
MQAVGIIGGGLAGLCLAIQLAQKGIKTTLFEKKQYPFHRVCGEYIAFESWGFLKRLGVPLEAMNLPRIQKLRVSAPNGVYLEQNMPSGGFGISRFSLDAHLARIAQHLGVEIIHENVENVIFLEDSFEVKTEPQTLYFKVVCGAFGKRSNLDILLDRDFIKETKNASKQFVGVKYHIRYPNFPEDLIELHNFSGGYCGISKIEDDRYCMCYLTESHHLTKNNQSIALMEQNVLYQNPFLKKYFSEATFLYQKPLTISQISFASKPLVENHILMLGDSAGMITPLCGNGMTMAMQASALLAPEILLFLEGKQNRDELERRYQKQWKATFEWRMRIGRWLQHTVFGDIRSSNWAIRFFRKTPWLVSGLVKLTHGEAF